MDAKNAVGDALRKVKLVQRHEHGDIAFPCQLLDQRKEFELVADIKIGGRFIEHKNIRLLRHCPCQHDTLPLPVTDLCERHIPQLLYMGHLHGFVHNTPILRRQDAKSAGVRIAPGGCNILAGHELRVDASSQKERKALCKLDLTHLGFGLAVDQDGTGKRLKLQNDSVLIIEGIHALNPLLTKEIPDDKKYKIYISALTSISIDDHNWIPTRDNRLLRRIIRDYNKGAFTAQETIAQWKNVCEAEDKWIFPFQETADVMFNSALNIEFAVLRTHAELILASVPKNCPEYAEAHRLLKFIHFFIPVSDKEIPPTSIMREFVGGSSFKY